jgi:hypothetical protein
MSKINFKTLDKKVIAGTYIIFCTAIFLFAKNSLKQDGVKIIEKPEKKKEVSVHPAKVWLNINNQYTYTTRLQTSDSVEDLLENLRNKDNFSYKVTAYNYGTEITEINGIKSTENTKWKIYKEEEDITYKISKTPLTDETTYLLTLEKIETN